MKSFPKKIIKTVIPPIKCQGIKSKLVPFIAQNVNWNGKGKWIEPFLGSGVVVFNLMPDSAILGDTNKHIIEFYKKIQKGDITKTIVKEVLCEMGSELSKKGGDFYYEIRESFNNSGDSLKFLFLNRSCFNGLMRFNSRGEFNVPFGHKPFRFSKSYITKISNQVENIGFIIKDKDWTFQATDWKKTLTSATKNDFVYLDPPYIGRHTDYYNTWNEDEAIKLSEVSSKLPCEFALSMWLENKYRKNTHIKDYWQKSHVKTFSHFYHIGSKESLRNKMIEALVLKSNRINTFSS
jgi:DNA adenine methylase